MIGDIFCNDDSDKIKYYKDKLTLAQERIKQFSALSTIFNNFNNYETMLNEGKDIPKNVVFNLISSDYFDDTYNQDNSLRSAGTCNSIKILEDAINQFFVTNPDPEKDYPEFCNRLTDSDNFTSIQAYGEVIIAYDIAVKIGVQNVHLHYVSPITGKKPDLLLNLDRKNIFLELTALETRKPELKIKEIASETANYMLKKSIKSGYLVSILFDTMIVNKFTNEQGWIIVEDVIAHFKEMIDRLHLDELIGMNGSVRFHDKKIQLIAGKVLFSTIDEAIIYVESEQSENKSVLESIKIDIADKIKNKEDLKNYELFESWANKVSLKDFLNSPFDTVGFTTGGNNGCVYINSLDYDSTDENLKGSYLISTSQIAKASFIEHIKRRIKEKIDRKQYEVNSIFVIGIQAAQWQFEYEFDYEDFVPIRNEVQKYLEKYPEVSGVILFTSDLYRGKFIDNPNAAQKATKDIFEKSGILYPHVEPQCTHDRKVELSGMNYDQKVAQIMELLDKEKTKLYCAICHTSSVLIRRTDQR